MPRLVTSAAKAAYDMAFPSIRPGGILLVVGLPAESICFQPIQMAASEVHIQASSVGTRQDLREVLAMAAAGKVHCQVTTRPAGACQRKPWKRSDTAKFKADGVGSPLVVPVRQVTCHEVCPALSSGRRPPLSRVWIV